MKRIKAKDFDKAFDRGDNITEYLDLEKGFHPNQQIKRVNVDFPKWVIAGLDNEAGRLGVTRQSLIKMWIAERLDKTRGIPG